MPVRVAVVVVDDQHAQRLRRRGSGLDPAGHRDLGAHARAPARRGVDLERAAEQSGALGHAVAGRCRRAVTLDLRPVEAVAVVLDEQRSRPRRRRRCRCAPTARGVLQRVGQRLLRDPEQRVRQVRRGARCAYPTSRGGRRRRRCGSPTPARAPAPPPATAPRAGTARGRARSAGSPRTPTRAAARASAERVGRVRRRRPAASAPRPTRSCSSTETSPWATVSCTSRAMRLRSSAAASARALASAASCRRAYVIASAACFAKTSSRSASAGAKHAPASRLNTTQEPTIEPRHQIGTPITPLQRRAILRADVPARHLRVVVEDHRTAPRARSRRSRPR